MGYQFNEITDKRLDELESALFHTLGVIENHEQEKDVLWKSIFDAFTDAGLSGAARFVCRDGFTLSREVRVGQPRLDSEKLYDQLKDALGVFEANKIWKRITTRTVTVSVDEAKLERAVKSGLITPAVVQEAISLGKETTARTRRKTSKEDKKLLESGMIETGGDRQDISVFGGQEETA